MNEEIVDFKIVILARYCGQFQPADEKSATERKTSEDIVLDLRPMADYSTNEIAAYLAVHDYTISFDGDTPVWLMRKEQNNQLPEH